MVSDDKQPKEFKIDGTSIEPSAGIIRFDGERIPFKVTDLSTAEAHAIAPDMAMPAGTLLMSDGAGGWLDVTEEYGAQTIQAKALKEELQRLTTLLLPILYNEFDNNEIAFHQIAMNTSADQFVTSLAAAGSNKATEMQNVIEEARERIDKLIGD